PWIKKLFKGRARPKLSQAALESLAIIAFKQPISRVEVDAIRGVHSGGVIKNLLERNLISIAGRAQTVGKPILYGTTSEFLRYFGINDISELPKPKEIEEIMGKLDGAEEYSEEIIHLLSNQQSAKKDGKNDTAE
ncbi:MAG: SMC-Scp complex subunit ScpB, partial [bacterium]